jgi:hypothetical protein
VHPFFVVTVAVLPALVVFGAGFSSSTVGNVALAVGYYIISVKLLRWAVK